MKSSRPLTRTVSIHASGTPTTARQTISGNTPTILRRISSVRTSAVRSASRTAIPLSPLVFAARYLKLRATARQCGNTSIPSHTIHLRKARPSRLIRTAHEFSATDAQRGLQSPSLSDQLRRIRRQGLHAARHHRDLHRRGDGHWPVVLSIAKPRCFATGCR